MGGGIAQVVAGSGRRVSLYDAAPGAVDHGLETMRRSLGKLAEKGGADPDEVLGRVEPVDDLVAADLMIEAVVEDPAVKTDVFRRADELFPAEAILASNTSSIPIGSLAAATGRPDRVVGMHFFNPVPLMALVEVIRATQTSEATMKVAFDLCKALGKVPVESADRPGFIANRVLMPMINEAIYAVDEHVGTPEAIDQVMKLGMNHPMGPLTLADFIGLDVCLAILRVLRDGFNDAKYTPCPLLERMVAEGKLGRKSGEGFYKY